MALKRTVLFLILFALPLFGFSQQTKSLPPKEKNTETQVCIPKNLDECFSELKKILTPEEVAKFKNEEEKKAVSSAHLGLGMWMRNNWGLWSGSVLKNYFNQMGIFHPDDMSSIILTSFHRKLNNKDIQLEEQIKFYQDYWEKAKQKENK
jgi:hypothetical protein